MRVQFRAAESSGPIYPFLLISGDRRVFLVDAAHFLRKAPHSVYHFDYLKLEQRPQSLSKVTRNPISMAATTVNVVRTVPKAISGLVPKEMTEPLVKKPRNLYETLSRLPADGVGSRVYQTRWTAKGIGGCFWEVSRVSLKKEGTHGKAWGRLVWRGEMRFEFVHLVNAHELAGKPINEKEEKIRGSLKYLWMDGVSKGDKCVLYRNSSSLLCIANQ